MRRADTTLATLLPRVLLATLALANASAFGADWLQSGYDAAHHGVNPVETALGVGNVGSLILSRSGSLPIAVAGGGAILGGVGTPFGERDMLFLTSQYGTLLALDASSLQLVWSQPTAGGALVHATPAVDPDRRFVYGFGGFGEIHKYAVVDGTESFDQGWPQLVTLKPGVEHGASGLTIGVTSEGKRYLYAVTDGYFGDGGDYQGHLTTIDLDTGEQSVFNALCSDVPIHFVDGGKPGINDCDSRRAGIWGRPGATFDGEAGRVYVVTGNGSFDALFGGFDWGDSVLALSANGTGVAGLPADSYTPTNYDELELGDIDLGSGSIAVIGEVPGSDAGRLGVLVGKDGIVRLLSLDDLSGAGAPGNIGGELQAIGSPWICKCTMPQPASWTAPDGSKWVYVAANGSSIDAYQVVVTAGLPQLEHRWSAQSEYPAYAATPIVANGVLYLVDFQATALDAVTGKVLWQYGPIDSARRSSPIVVNGRLYVIRDDSVAVFAPEVILADGFETQSRAQP